MVNGQGWGWENAYVNFEPTDEQNISWHKPYYSQTSSGNPFLNYIVPSYSESNQQIEIKAEISTYSPVYSRVDLTFSIEVIPNEPDPGYNIIPLPSGVTVEDNGCITDHEEHVQSAFNTILADYPEMYNTVFGSNEIDIILSTSEIDDRLKSKPGTALYGSSSLGTIVGNRIKIDPAKMEFWEDEANPNQFSECPKNLPILLVITGDEYATLKTEVMNIASTDIPEFVNRIHSIYPEIGDLLNQYCTNPYPNLVEKQLGMLDIMNNEKKLCYEASQDELGANIQWDNSGYIILAIDHLNDIKKYLTVNGFPPLIGTKLDLWLADASCDDIEDVRQKKYDQIVAHEMAHIYYKLTHPVKEVYKWSKMEDIHSNINSCYHSSGNDDQYCSNDKGHAYNNPNGIFTCDIVHNILGYEDPVESL